MKNRLLILSLFYLFFSLLNSTTWEIKLDGSGDFTAIQTGIDASVVGDTVLVYPGTYFENINFSGKDIVVGSLLLTTGEQNYMYNTIIDANHNGRVVTFENNETNEAVLIGFTIQNGLETNPSTFAVGAGVLIDHSSPSLKFLLIKKNVAKAGAGIAIDSCNSYFESVTIKENHAFGNAGGLQIRSGSSYPIFNETNKCNIYNNYAGYASDIYITEYHTPLTNIILDTLSVFEPGWDFVSQFSNIELDIEHDWLEQVEQDLYVSPDGENNNSGLNENEPLQTIHWALTKIKADSLNPRNIYLAPGSYSPDLTGEMFPLNIRAYVSIIGAGIDESILTDPYEDSHFIRASYDESFSISDLTMMNCSYTQYELIFSTYTNTRFTNLKICNNIVEDDIFYLSRGEEVAINNVIFENNSSRQSLAIGSPSIPDDIAIINNLTISGNEPVTGSGDVGSVLNLNSVHYAKITNSLFFNNNTEFNGWPPCHFYFFDNDTLDFFNNTITNNSSSSGHGCLIGVGGGDEVNIKNCNIYDNSTPYVFRKSIGEEPMNINISHSIIEGGEDAEILSIAGSGEYWPELNFGEGITDEPPLFAGGDWDDPFAYQLTEDSPGIDAGTPDTTGMYLPLEDLLGNWRVWDGDGDNIPIIDIGCYEFNSTETTDNELPNTTTSNIINYPNPFSISGKTRVSATTFKFNILKEGKVRLNVYNIKGQKVKNLIDMYSTSGNFETMWNGLDDSGKPVSTGIYFYRLESSGVTEIKKLIIVK